MASNKYMRARAKFVKEQMANGLTQSQALRKWRKSPQFNNVAVLTPHATKDMSVLKGRYVEARIKEGINKSVAKQMWLRSDEYQNYLAVIKDNDNEVSGVDSHIQALEHHYGVVLHTADDF